jgi:hypothetical protein
VITGHPPRADGVPGTAGDSLGYLLGRAAIVEQRVRELVAERRAADPAPDDPFRGLYLNDDAVDLLLGSAAAAGVTVDHEQLAILNAEAEQAERSGNDIRLRRPAREAGLALLDVELLMIALRPDLDSRFERLYGYLNDDVTRRRASVGLALQLAGASGLSAAARSRLEPSRPLIRQGLIVVEDPERPMLTRGLRVPDRVVAHLLGDDAPDAELAGLIIEVAGYQTDLSSQLAHALASGVRLVHLKERIVGSGAATAVAALAEFGTAAVVVDLGRLAAVHDPRVVTSLAVREALLRGAGLVIGPIEQVAEPDADVVRWLAEADVPLLLFGASTWDPHWSTRNPLAVDAPLLTVGHRIELWTRELDATGHEAAAGVDAEGLAGHLALGSSRHAPGIGTRCSRSGECAAVGAAAAGSRRYSRVTRGPERPCRPRSSPATSDLIFIRSTSRR